MNRSKKNNILLLFLAVIAGFSNLILAQNSDDLEGWSAVQLDVRASKKMTFSVSEHLRYRNDITTVSTYFTQIETNYEVIKDLN